MKKYLLSLMLVGQSASMFAATTIGGPTISPGQGLSSNQVYTMIVDFGGGSATNVNFIDGSNTDWSVVGGSNKVDIIGTLSNNITGNATTATTSTNAPDGRLLAARQTNSAVLYVSANPSVSPVKGDASNPYDIITAFNTAVAGEIIHIAPQSYTVGTLEPKDGVKIVAHGAVITGTNQLSTPTLIPPTLRLTNNITVVGGTWTYLNLGTNYSTVIGNTKDDGNVTNYLIMDAVLSGPTSDIYYNGQTNSAFRHEGRIFNCQLINSGFDAVTMIGFGNTNRYLKLVNCFISATNIMDDVTENRGLFAQSGYIEIVNSRVALNNGTVGNIGLKVEGSGFEVDGYITAINVVFDINGTTPYEASHGGDYESAATPDRTNIVMIGCSRLNGQPLRKRWVITENTELTQIIDLNSRGGSFIGNGAGLTNIPITGLQGSGGAGTAATNGTAGQVWTSAGNGGGYWSTAAAGGTNGGIATLDGLGTNTTFYGVFSSDTANENTNTYGGLLSKMGTRLQGGIASEANAPYSFAFGDTVIASGDISFGVGSQNTASGQYSHVSGLLNEASGLASQAAGRNAHATNDNTYVWGDGSFETGSTTSNQWTARAENGFRFLGGPVDIENMVVTNLYLPFTNALVWANGDGKLNAVTQYTGITFTNGTLEVTNLSLNAIDYGGTPTVTTNVSWWTTVSTLTGLANTGGSGLHTSGDVTLLSGSTDYRGKIRLYHGTSAGTAVTNLFTLTFSTPFASIPTVISSVTFSNVTTTQIGPHVADITVSNVLFRSGSTAPAANAASIIQYWVIP